MTNIEQHDGFDQARAAIPSCSLDRPGARAQKDRYRAIAPFITDVWEEAMTVVVKLADDLDGAAVDEVIAVEHHCCVRVLDFEFHRPARSLRVTARDSAAKRPLELIASGFKQSLAPRAFHVTAGGSDRSGPWSAFL